jgi:hypothetical protein
MSKAAEFELVECKPLGRLPPARLQGITPRCKIEALLLSPADSKTCSETVWADELYRLGKDHVFPAFRTIWLIESGRAHGPYTAALVMKEAGAHTACLPKALQVGSQKLDLKVDSDSDGFGGPVLPENIADALLVSSGTLRGIMRSPDPTPISCYWLGCNDRRSIQIEVRTDPPGLAILLDGSPVFVTNQRFWISVHRRKGLRVRLVDGKVRNLFSCKRSEGGDGVAIYHC